MNDNKSNPLMFCDCDFKGVGGKKRLKTKPFCQTCYAERIADCKIEKINNMFCPNCGTNMVIATPPLCKKCGAELVGDRFPVNCRTKYCQSCGLVYEQALHSNRQKNKDDAKNFLPGFYSFFMESRENVDNFFGQ